MASNERANHNICTIMKPTINQKDEIVNANQRIGKYCTLRNSPSLGSVNNNTNIVQCLTADTVSRTIGNSDLPNYCTVSRKLRRIIKSQDDHLPPYKKLKESENDLAASSSTYSMNFGGLSNNLSSESIKNACEFYDELSDEYDSSYRKKAKQTALHRFEQQKAVTLDRKKKVARHQNQFCTLRHENKNRSTLHNCLAEKQNSNSSLALQQEEAFIILNELDAILDNHIIDRSSPLPSNRASSSYLPAKNEKPVVMANIKPGQVEDCLLELDAYLDQIDHMSSSDESSGSMDPNKFSNNNLKVTTKKLVRSRTLPKKLRLSKTPLTAVQIHLDNNFNSISNANEMVTTHHDQHDSDNDLGETIKSLQLRRGHKLRRTINNGGVFQMKILTQPTSESTVTTTTSLNMDSHNFDAIQFHNEKELNANNPSSISSRKTWRRNSMRKTSLLILPEHQNQSAHQYQNQREPCEFSDPFKSNNEIASVVALSDQEIVDNLSNINDHRSDSDSMEMSFHASSYEMNSDLNQLPNNSTMNADVRRCFSENDFGIENDISRFDVLQNIMLNSLQNPTIDDNNRPRQFGRRADGHPRIFSILAETNTAGDRRIIVNHENRPMSAPATTTSTSTSISTSTSTSALATATGRRQLGTSSLAHQCNRYIGSEPSSVGSSRNPSPVSLLSSTGSSSIGSTSPDQTSSPPIENVVTTHRQPRLSPLDPENIYIPPNCGINAQWPHSFSRVLALLCCTLGLFNISRFAIQTINYGGNFVLQFLILSVIFGIPLLWLQMCLGAKIKAGPVSMWKISPICKGIGIALILAQGIIALYSTVSLGWVIIYLRDSFLTKTQQLYRWQEPLYIYRRPINTSSYNLTETLADYFNGIVLQRVQLGLGRRIDTGGVRFQLAFNLAVIWSVVFLILCKGLRSFGKAILPLTILPLAMFLAVTCKLLYIIDFSSVQNIFSASDFENFLINSKTWTAAAQESFLTWGLLGPSIISMSSRSTGKSNSKTVLRRDAIIVVLITMIGLCLAAMFGYACVQILKSNDYIYQPGSFENMESYIYLYSVKDQINPSIISFPTKWLPHYSTVMGECYRRPPIISTSNGWRESGYQSLRLITELFPATVAVSQDTISSVWTILTFLMFIFFGLAQLCAIWKPISSALGNSTSSVLLSCVTGILLGIPFATEMGISIIYFFDLIIGGAWWLLILWTAEILGVFLIRGRPYNGDVLVNDLHMTGSMSAFLALSWNVLLPIGLVTLAVIQYKVSLSNQFFHWRGKAYFPYWVRKVGGLTQVGFLLLVPFIAIIQIYRYLSSGPPDILDRIQLLYRPVQSPIPHRRNPTSADRSGAASTTLNTNTIVSLETQMNDDAPPKYTPPPSYTTATGARLAKMLRLSIRRSVRRILGEPSRQRPSIPTTSNHDDNCLPPEYSTVLTDPSGQYCNEQESIEIGPRALYNSYTQRSLSLGRPQRLAVKPTPIRQPSSTSCGPAYVQPAQPFTAFDVAGVLRSSTRRHERSVSAIATRVDNVLRSSSLRTNKTTSRSAENLVLNAAPLGESSAIILSGSSSINHDDRLTDTSMIDENTSVI